MNVTDIIVIVVIVLSGLLALARGFVKEVLGVAGWVGAGFATLYLFPVASPYAHRFIAVPWLANIATGAVIFVVSLILLSALSHAIALRVHQSQFSALDKSLGLVFGLLRGAVVVSIAYLALAWAVPADQYPPWVRQARTMPLVERGAQLIEQLIPQNARRRGLAAMGEAQDKAKQGLEAAKAVQQFAAPQPKASAPKDADGYTPEERRDLNRAIETSQ
jgi:membrane protein required for colicin V production